jgi:precorrin-2/cobalt-factor-2 C20-methyltransferase
MSDYQQETQAKTHTGKLYGVGIGPGSPELVTLRAHHILSRVPVIFVPKKSEQSDSIAESVINGLTPEIKATVTGLVLPMLKDKSRLEHYWNNAAETIWQTLKRGDDCAFVNIGDPLFYGTFIHILNTIRKKHPEVPVEVVPGISSFHAAAASAIIPLASDDERVAILSGKRDEMFIRNTLENFDTVVFMKINSIFDTLLTILSDMDLLDKCVYFRRCTTENEEIIYDINTLKDKKVDYFSLLIVRK